LVALEVARAVAVASSRWLDTVSEDYDVKIMAATNRIVLDPPFTMASPLFAAHGFLLTVVVGSLAWWHDLRRDPA